MVNIHVYGHGISRNIETSFSGNLLGFFAGEHELHLGPLSDHAQVALGAQTGPATRQAVRQQEEPLDSLRHLQFECVQQVRIWRTKHIFIWYVHEEGIPLPTPVAQDL